MSGLDLVSTSSGALPAELVHDDVEASFTKVHHPVVVCEDQLKIYTT